MKLAHSIPPLAATLMILAMQSRGLLCCLINSPDVLLLSLAATGAAKHPISQCPSDLKFDHAHLNGLVSIFTHLGCFCKNCAQPSLTSFIAVDTMLQILVATLGLLSLVHARATPHPIRLQAVPSNKGPSLRKRALNPTTIPLADDFLGTDLQWFGNMTVGTPPQTLPIVFDTGSSTLEFASTLCAACSHQVQFDPTKSSTFVDGGQITHITFATGGGVDPVIGDNYRLTLRSGSDTVSAGGLTAPSVSLFLVVDQTAKFDRDPYSGIQGLSARAEGLFKSLEQQGLPSLFSLYVTPQAVGNAELILGGIDDTKFIGSPIFASTIPASSAWVVTSPGLSVNGKTTSLLSMPRDIIFDSGTSNILFSTDTTEAIYALISPDVKPNPNEPGAYGIACDKISSLPAVIDIAFTSQDGKAFNLTIPSCELSVGPFTDDPSICQTLINAFDGLEVVGGSLMKHWYTIWDLGGRRMGFAPAKLNSGSSTHCGTSAQIPHSSL